MKFVLSSSCKVSVTLELLSELIHCFSACQIRDCADKFAHIFTFSIQNMRNNKLKDVRQEWSQSR